MIRLSVLVGIVVLTLGCARTVPPTPTPGTTPTFTPAPTASPTPTATLAPTEPPSPSGSVLPTIPPTGPPDGLHVDSELIAGHLDALQAIADANDGIRAAGTPGYDASADYVEQVMTELGFQVERHSFDFPFFDEVEPVEVGFGDIGWTSPQWLHAALYSASGDVEAESEYIFGGCDPADWNAFTAGHIAMVEGGGCYMRQKVENAQAAGAVALISFYTWAANEIRRPTLLDPDGITIPVVVAGTEPSDALRGQAGQIVNVYVEGDNHIATVDNIIATWPGATERVVMLGGHLDSVLDGPGLNDNGSGVAALLAMAASIAAQPQPQSTIRFGFWSAEEFGDLGSFAYVDSLGSSELGLMDAYVNLDMVGSPNPGRFVYDEATSPAGSSDITASLLAGFEALGQPARTIDTGGSSDHYAFALAGIPVGGVFSGLSPMEPLDVDLFGGEALVPMDPCYHLICDARANVDLESAALQGQVVANLLEDLAY